YTTLFRSEGSRLFRSQGFSPRRPQQKKTIVGMVKESLTIPDIRKKSLAILEMGKQLRPTKTTIAPSTKKLCGAIGMNGTTTIGGSNTISLSCWSEADTIIATRDIGILHGDTILIMSAMITTDRFTPMAICCRIRPS